MTPVATGFAVLLGIVLGIALIAPERRMLAVAWFALLLSWGLTVIVAHNGPTQVFLYAAFDAVCGMLAAMAYRRTRHVWVLLLAMLWAAACMGHVLWYAFDVFGPTDEMRLGRYYIFINVVYLLQLCTVAWPGVCCGVAAVLSLVRGIGDKRHSGKLARR